MSRQGNISVKQKNTYKRLYSKAEVNFARQFGYEKAIKYQNMWSIVKSNPKKFKELANKHGFTDYAIGLFLKAKGVK